MDAIYKQNYKNIAENQVFTVQRGVYVLIGVNDLSTQSQVCVFIIYGLSH